MGSKTGLQLAYTQSKREFESPSTDHRSTCRRRRVGSHLTFTQEIAGSKPADGASSIPSIPTSDAEATVYRQYELSSGKRRVTCWLESDRQLPTNAVVTLDHDPRPWLVVSASEIELRQPPDRRWNVGGLQHGRDVAEEV